MYRCKGQSHLTDEVAAHAFELVWVFGVGGGGSRTKPINGTGVWTRLRKGHDLSKETSLVASSCLSFLKFW